MKTIYFALPLTILVPLAGCGGSGATASSGGTSSGGTGGASGGPGSGAGTSTGSSGSGGGAPQACEAFGHYGTPKEEYTIPGPNAGGGISYPDIQKSLPMVSWNTIDRLYITAGKYKFIQIGNLPKRDATRPLVITNKGGQVQVGPNDPGGNFIWGMSGGSNWVLTGRYDPDSKTGDVNFPGHRCGEYGTARGKYGFFSDDAYAKGQYLHMGIAVTDSTSFELEFLEIYRSGFAGIRLLNQRNAGDPEFPMDNVRVHDNYVHDTDGEGFYIGWTGAPPSNLLSKLQIYNNRIIRTGNEALQIQNLGDGTEVHHNVVAFAALHWRDNGLGAYQDNNAQVQTRQGKIELHHNIFMGGANTILSFFSGPEQGDPGRDVTFHDNYFANTVDLGSYLNGTSGNDSTYTFSKNFFRGLDFAYDVLNPANTDPGVIFGKNPPFASPINFNENTWEGSRKIIAGLNGPNGTAGNFTAMNNTNGPVTEMAFVDSGYPSKAYLPRLEAWAPVATLTPGMPAITYDVGALVMFDGEMYQATMKNTGFKPTDHPEAWTKVPTPKDDVRVAPGSPYQGMGVY